MNDFGILAALYFCTITGFVGGFLVHGCVDKLRSMRKAGGQK